MSGTAAAQSGRRGLPRHIDYAWLQPEELAANSVHWPIRPARAALLVHDMQAYFLRPLAAAMAGTLVAQVAALIGWARARAVPVAYTAQPGAMSPQQRGLLADFWGPGMQLTATDRAIAPDCRPQAQDWQFVKWRYSAFHATDLLSRLRQAGVQQLIICGVYAHVGILTTALEAFSHDLQVFIVADAVADFSRDLHRQALAQAARCCARIVYLRELPR